MGAERIQVVGGGVAGLSLAYFLTRYGKEVRLVEKSGRYGGLIRTLQTPYGMVETAANAMLANRLVEDTARELDIELTPTLPSARRRFIYRDGRMRRWPLSLGGSLRLGKAITTYLRAKERLAPLAGESVQHWGERALGAEATKYLLTPALTGIYAGDPSKLSASLILGRFFRKEKGPDKGKLKGSVAPLGGMETWIRAFTEYLKECGTEFSNQWEEGLPTIVALPPHRAAEFLTGKADGLAEKLKRVEMLSLVSVTCFYPPDTNSIQGFGCLFPESEGFRVRGILANHSIFPGRVLNTRSETWIFGGAKDPDVLNLSDEELVALIQTERERLLGKTEILHTEISRWPKAIPHYNLELEKLLLDIRPENNFSLFGTYLGDLGLARVLLQAEERARKL